MVQMLCAVFVTGRAVKTAFGGASDSTTINRKNTGHSVAHIQELAAVTVGRRYGNWTTIQP